MADCLVADVVEDAWYCNPFLPEELISHVSSDEEDGSSPGTARSLQLLFSLGCGLAINDGDPRQRPNVGVRKVFIIVQVCLVVWACADYPSNAETGEEQEFMKMFPGGYYSSSLQMTHNRP